jgi:hypothetical protein
MILFLTTFPTQNFGINTFTMLRRLEGLGRDEAKRAVAIIRDRSAELMAEALPIVLDGHRSIGSRFIATFPREWGPPKAPWQRRASPYGTAASGATWSTNFSAPCSIVSITAGLAALRFSSIDIFPVTPGKSLIAARASRTLAPSVAPAC